MKKLCVLLAFLLILAFCFPAIAEESPLKIGYLCQTQDFEFHNMALEGTIAACKEQGIDLMYQVVGTDPTLIRSVFDSFVTQGMNVLINFSCSGEANQSVAKLCEQKNILHICVDADVTDYGSTTYFFGLDNFNAGDILGEGAANWMAENVDKPIDHVITVNATSLGDEVWHRTENAVEYLKSTGAITDEQVHRIDMTDFDLANVKQKVQDYLTLCSDYETIVIFGLSSSWTPPIEAAVTASGLTDHVYLFSVDGVSETIDTFKAVAAGEKETILKGEVATHPEYYGETLLEDIKKIRAGEDVDRHLYSVNGWMTKDNVYEFYPD